MDLIYLNFMIHSSKQEPQIARQIDKILTDKRQKQPPTEASCARRVCTKERGPAEGRRRKARVDIGALEPLGTWTTSVENKARKED